LVVDDRVDVAMSLALLLKQQGYKVQMANHAHEALEKAGLFLPDVVFLDIGLPDLSGYDVCLEMRRSEWGAKAFIVAVTGRNEAEDLLRAAQTGFDRHVGKPMGFGTLREILRTVETRPA
jgi:DNA-binding response OmpR family regulator